MPFNGMQRRSKSSFFLGMLVTLIIVALAGVILYFLYLQPRMKDNINIEVYRLKNGANVKSGQEITANMLELAKLPVKTKNTDFVTEPITGYKSKIDLKEGTILTYNMLYNEEKGTEDSVRYVEYACISMPVTLDTNKYVDIRFRLPNGLDLIVVSKKHIENIVGDAIGLNLNEKEINLLNSAIVESYIMTGSELYMATYVEPGLQKESTYTYSPTPEVINLINTNPNIVASAREEITNNYRNSGNVRNPINEIENSMSAEIKNNNIEKGVRKQMEAVKQSREKYLSGLVGY